MSIEPGANFGAYRIVEQVGRGGMAIVYKAYQPALARHVAIKVLPAFFAEEEEFRERFQQEAIAIAKLRHPNILAVYDYGEESGQAYIVNEFVDGGTLEEQIGQPLPVEYTTRVLGPVGSALDYAHARGILHRDVKPSNMLLARDGTPVLADFGLAKMMGSLPRLTQTGTSVGTPEYMSPEHASGESIAPASDQYSLAVVAYEMLTGQVPFSAATPLAVLLAHVQKPLPLPRQVNPALSPAVEEVLLKGLAKTPADRYPSASAFVAALADAERTQAPVLTGQEPTATAAGGALTARSRQLIGAGAAVALLALGAVVLSFWRPVPVTEPLASAASAAATTVGQAAGPAPAEPASRTIDELWRTTDGELSSAWGTDWPRAIALLDAFLARDPGHAEANGKLYAALVEYGRDLERQGAVDRAIPQYLRAQALVPDRGEATAALVALTPAPPPTPTPVPTARVVATSAPAVATRPRPTPTPTKPPFAPVGR